MNTVSTISTECVERESDWLALSEVVSDPGRFAAKFNRKVPGAYRSITAEDIRRMANCGLIGRHGFFTREDLETVRSILRYERLRETEGLNQ